jgi:ubiquinone/menaquinone biosynthesis C-methylase UbiE
MPAQHDDEKKPNSYVIDAESAAEMARLMRQDQAMTAGMGGPLSEIDLNDVQHVLDLACGPAGWALDLAYTYSDMEIMGIDISERMIAYASTQALVQQRNNVSFRVMDILKPLDLPDNSFDLVNARFLSSFLQRENWSWLFREILRIVRPGGIVRLTEPEAGMTNKPHLEQAIHVGMQAMGRAGLNFSPHGYHYGIVHMLPSFFRQADLPIQGQRAHFIEYSFGTEAHESFYHDLTLALHLFEPLVVKMQLATAQEWRELTRRGLAEMYEEDFCAAWMLLTVWGEKPL